MAGIRTSVLAEDVRSGQTFIRFRFVQQDIDSLTADLNYASTPAVIQSALQVEEYGNKVLQFLKDSFPSKNRSAAFQFAAALAMKKSPNREIPKPMNLREGWRVTFYSAASVQGGNLTSTASLWGFYLRHAQENNPRIKKILSSLNDGSTAYSIKAKAAGALTIPTAYPAGSSFQFAQNANIPARKGYYFVERTEKYADDLLVRHGSRLEEELQSVVEKGKRLREVALGATSASTPALDAVKDSPAIISALAKQKSPLKAWRQSRVQNRRFRK